MAIVGTVSKNKYGRLQARHAYYSTVTGPSSDVSIANGATGTVTFSFTESPRDAYAMGLESISGLPSGVYIAGISVDKSAKTLTLTLFNNSGGDVTVSANSLTATIVVIS